MKIIYEDKNRVVNLDNFDEMRIEETGMTTRPCRIVAVRYADPKEVTISLKYCVSWGQAEMIYRQILDMWVANENVFVIK